MRDPDYQGFWDMLPHVALLAHQRPEMADDFRRQYREEIVTAVMQLHRVGVFGGASEVHPNPPDDCDACGIALNKYGCFVDGQTAEGEWANMCPICFYKKGHSVGWGTGQLYINVEPGRWRLLAGGDPTTCEVGND